MKAMRRPHVLLMTALCLPVVVLGLRRPAEEAPDQVRVLIETDTGLEAESAEGPVSSRREIPSRTLIEMPTATEQVVLPMAETRTLPTVSNAPGSTVLARTIPISTAPPVVNVPESTPVETGPTDVEAVEVLPEVRWVTGHLDELAPVAGATADTVRAVVLEAWASHITSLRNPDDQSLHDHARSLRSGFAQRVVDVQWSDYRTLSLYARPALSIPSSITVTSIGALDNGRVVAWYCAIDSEIIMERNGDPRGGDSFHNVAVAREEGRFGLLLTEGVWIVDDVHVTDRQVSHPQHPSEVTPC